MTDSTIVRDAAAEDVEQLSRVWHEAWHDAHAGLVPAELIQIRTRENFHARLAAMLPLIRVATSEDRIVGFCAIRSDELYQLFVARQARGSGVAAALIADGEERLRRNGVDTAYLACAIGNDRAARFYERHGWSRTGTMVNLSETESGTFSLDVWRYEKALAPAGTSRAARDPGASRP